MIAKIKAFGVFWYDFVVGDDWRVAAGVAVALATTFIVSESTATGWWIVPTAVLVLLPASLWRATHLGRQPTSQES